MSPPYLPALKKALVRMADFAEDFDDDFHMGVCLWNRNNREMWQEIRVERDRQLMEEMKREDRRDRAEGRRYYGMRFC